MQMETPGAFTLLLRLVPIIARPAVPTIAPIAVLRPVLSIVPVALPIPVATTRLLLRLCELRPQRFALLVALLRKVDEVLHVRLRSLREPKLPAGTKPMLVHSQV